MTRARSSFGAQAWTAAKTGTMNRPAAMARSRRSSVILKPATLARKAATPIGSGPGAVCAATQAMSRPTRPIRMQPIGAEHQDDPPGDQARREHRADADADREGGEEEGRDMRLAADDITGERRDERQDDGADKPEPATPRWPRR